LFCPTLKASKNRVIILFVEINLNNPLSELVYLVLNYKSMFRNLNKIDLIMLFLAFLSLITSETLWFKGDREASLFVGLWVPSILGFAIYLKLLKIERK
jgi:hypothetical protein